MPAPLKQAIVTSLISRWSAIMAHAGMHALAASLLSLPADNAIDGDEVLLPLGQLVPRRPSPPPTPVDFRGGEGGSRVLDFALVDYAHLVTGQYKTVCRPSGTFWWTS